MSMSNLCREISPRKTAITFPLAAIKAQGQEFQICISNDIRGGEGNDRNKVLKISTFKPNVSSDPDYTDQTAIRL